MDHNSNKNIEEIDLEEQGGAVTILQDGSLSQDHEEPLGEEILHESVAGGLHGVFSALTGIFSRRRLDGKDRKY